MNNQEGKIIVISGGSRSGKSTLVKLLAEHFNGQAFFEGEEKDFPKRIIDDMVSGNNLLELMLWFRNLNIQQYKEAVEAKKGGKTVVMDCFWLTTQPYIDLWMTDQFQKELITKTFEIDTTLLPWPDQIIALTQTEDGIKDFFNKSNRTFEKDEKYIEKQLAIHKEHAKYFESLQKTHDNITFFDRTGLDFVGNKEDLDRIIALLK
jgi:deoxyadenosine/deoxycytidine kinase